jgi:ribosomal protein S18 acetylase RimI-like enzyme
MDYPCEMKYLCKDSLRDLARLQSQIAENLPEPEIFRLHDEVDFKDIFQGDHSVIGVTTAVGLIAYSIIRIPGLAEDNLGRDLNLTEREQMKVAHLQATVVHPHFRGNGLQRKMARAHLEEIAEMGYEHVLCTVSPKNPVSLSNILSCGFVIKGLIPKFGGWWRYILYKGTQGPSCTSTGSGNLPGDEVRVRCLDTKGQIDLLVKGFVGVRLAIGSKNPEVIYQKILSL